MRSLLFLKRIRIQIVLLELPIDGRRRIPAVQDFCLAEPITPIHFNDTPKGKPVLSDTLFEIGNGLPLAGQLPYFAGVV